MTQPARIPRWISVRIRGPFLRDDRPRRFGPPSGSCVSYGTWHIIDRTAGSTVRQTIWNSKIGAMIAKPRNYRAGRWGLSSHNPVQTDDKNPPIRLGSPSHLVLALDSHSDKQAPNRLIY